MNVAEPHFKKGACSYCGDAPVNHTFSYFLNLISTRMDFHIKKVARHAPKFLVRFADFIPKFTFETFALLGLAKFSDDIEKAKTFRSRVIWEEAKRRGIKMEQLMLWGKPMDYYRAFLNGRRIYFDSLPIPPEMLDMRENWDDKFALKRELAKNNIPAPECVALPIFYKKRAEEIFAKLEKPVIVKPRIGSRGRHTITNINTIEEFRRALKVAEAISPDLVAEEHLHGYICRATVVGGQLAGFYRAKPPHVVGDGKSTIRKLIEEKDKNRYQRVEKVDISEELMTHIAKSGFTLNDVLPEGMELSLSHRSGRLFGGTTREMLPLLHPSFVPILERVAKLLGLAVVGFDCIVPDPEVEASSQKWGIIEANTLPFIDLHYYALLGKPQNIAGMVWDLWGPLPGPLLAKERVDAKQAGEVNAPR